MKRLGIFLLPPLDGMLVHRRVTISIEFAGTHFYTYVERDTVGVKCLAQDHNTMSPARARTQTARSGVERTNHKATSKGSNENTVQWRPSFRRSRTNEIYSTSYDGYFCCSEATFNIFCNN